MPLKVHQNTLGLFQKKIHFVRGMSTADSTITGKEIPPRTLPLVFAYCSPLLRLGYAPVCFRQTKARKIQFTFLIDTTRREFRRENCTAGL